MAVKPSHKTFLIANAIALIPIAAALVPFTIAWYAVKGNVFEFDPVGNLPWIVLWIALWLASIKGLDLAAGWYLKRRNDE